MVNHREKDDSFFENSFDNVPSLFLLTFLLQLMSVSIECAEFPIFITINGLWKFFSTAIFFL